MKHKELERNLIDRGFVKDSTNGDLVKYFDNVELRVVIKSKMFGKIIDVEVHHMFKEETWNDCVLTQLFSDCECVIDEQIYGWYSNVGADSAFCAASPDMIKNIDAYQIEKCCQIMIDLVVPLVQEYNL